METYTTRCRLDLRMPPLNRVRESPILQIACPGTGYSCVRLGDSIEKKRKDIPVRIAIQCTQAEAPGVLQGGCARTTKDGNNYVSASGAISNSATAYQRTEVSVGTEGNLGFLSRLFRLRRVLDASCLRAAGFHVPVEVH